MYLASLGLFFLTLMPLTLLTCVYLVRMKEFTVSGGGLLLSGEHEVWYSIHPLSLEKTDR
jgi:hypothetical protein